MNFNNFFKKIISKDKLNINHSLPFKKIAIFLFFIGILITAFISWEASKQNQLIIDNALKERMNKTSKLVASRVELYQYGLRGARGTVLTGGEHGITRKQFTEYSNSRDIKTEFPGARGFGFIRRVAEVDERSFLDSARKDGMSNFSIRQLAPHSGERYVIQYVEPISTNLAAVGLDIASEVNRRTAADMAVRTGMPTLTGPITLVQLANKPKQSFLFLLPIYRSGKTPETIVERERMAFGWSYAVLNMQDILGKDVIDPNLGQLTIQDITNPDRIETIYETSQLGMPQQVIQQFAITKSIFGRVWNLNLRVYPSFYESLKLQSIWQISIIGVITSFVVAGLFCVWGLNRRRAHQLISAQLQLASIVENSIDAIIGKTLNGNVISWNKGAQNLFGFTPEEAVGKSLTSLIIPFGAEDEDVQILENIQKGKHIKHFQTLRQHKDGHTINVSVSVSPILNDRGEIIGASKNVRDISHQVAAENEIKLLNARLEGDVIERTAELEIARRTLRAVLDAVPSMIGYWDKNLINKVANHAYHDWLGIDPNSILGRTMPEVLGQKYYEENRPYVDAVLRGNKQTFERIMTHKNGSIRYSLGHYLPDIQDGEVKGFYVIVHDITELNESRSKLTSALRENESLLHTINEQLLYSATDVNGLIVEANDIFCKTHGFEREMIIGHNHLLFKSGIHPDSFWKTMWETILMGQAWHGEICNRACDGSLHWFDTVIAPSVNAKGVVDRFIALSIDITKSKATNDKAIQLDLFLSNLLRAASELSIIATDVNGIITVFNEGAQRMLGYSEDEMVGVSTPAPLHLKDEIIARGKELSEEYGETIKGFSVFTYVSEKQGAETREWTYITKNGHHLTVSLSVTTIRDKDNRITGYLGIATDISVQRSQQKDLAVVRDKLMLATKVAQLGIWSWELENNSLSWNAQMFALYQWPESLQNNGLTFEHWKSRIHPEDVDYAVNVLMHTLEEGDTYNSDFRIILPDNSIRFIQAAGYIERDNKGKAYNVTGTNLDITERKKFEETLLQAKLLAEQASISKGYFLANMSHEIRTPMNAVLGMLQLLQQTDLNSRQVDYASKAQIAARSLLGLLNDILDFSKIEAGKLELDLHVFDLEVLLRDLSVILSGNVGDKNLELMYDIDSKLPRELVGDKLRLQQVIINLAGNAIKFTQAGYVVISLAELERTNDQITLRITVTDTGIGISPEQINRIFEGFTQAEASTTRRYGGTGLGLSISKKIVNLMGGTLEISSEVDKGSRFWFDISLDVVKSVSIIPMPETTLKKQHVLIVDDNIFIGQIMTNAIESLGWSVEYATGGEMAFEMVSQAALSGNKFDCILMDWRMPDIDGVSAAKKIKHAVDEANTPIIIMVTAFGREVLNEMIDGEDVPFVDFLTKPVTPQQIYETIKRNSVTNNRHIKPSITKLELSRRLQGMTILVVEDNALNRQVAYELLIGEGAYVTLADGGLAGVELATNGKSQFDVVIMDIQMPDIDGMEATRRIRSDKRFNSLPILAMTANVSQSDRIECINAGMNEHIGKPIDMEEVVPTLLKLTGRRVNPSLLNKPSNEINSDFIEPINKVLKRMGGRADIYRTVLSNFAPECAQLINKLNQFIRDNKVKEIANTFHALKGVASAVGANGLANWASELERQCRKLTKQDAMNLFTDDMQTMLLTIIAESNEKLNAAFNISNKSQVTSSQDVKPFNVVETKAKLLNLLQLLESGNMQAIDRMDELLNHTIDIEKAKFTELSDQIHKLQFQNAIQTLGKIIEEIN
jgi:PAS domain S-box-containing protein